MSPMRIFLCSFISILLFLVRTATADGVGELNLGPVYTDHFPPQIEIVLPTPLENPEAVRLLEDGIETVPPTEIQSFGDLERGLALVVAVDTSRTMTGVPIQAVRTALGNLVSRLRPEDRVALVTFADDVEVRSPFGTPREELTATIRSLEAAGMSTELFKGLFKAFDLFEEPGLPARRRLVVISDGKDEGEAYTLDDVLTRAEVLNVPVDAIGLTRIDPTYLNNLERLADLSRGEYRRAQKAEDLERLLPEGLEALRASPVAFFTPSNLRADGGVHQVGIRLRSGERLLEGQLKVLMPPPPPPPPPASAEEEPKAPGTEVEDSRGLPLGLLAVLGLVLLLALLVLVWLYQRRQRNRRVPSAAPAAWKAVSPRPEPTPEVSPPAFSPRPPSPASPRPISTEPEARPARRAHTQVRVEFPRPEAGHPCALLVSEGAAEGSRQIPIEEEVFWIGAEEGNHLRMPDDSYLSGQHAYIQFHEGNLLVSDYGSTNGTFLNGQRLADKPRPLSWGDTLRVGGATFVVTPPGQGGDGDR